MSKLFSVEVAQAFEQKNIIDLAERAKSNTLDAEDKEVIEVIDNFAKELGRYGQSSENDVLIAELIKKNVEPMIFQPDTSILYDIFNFGSIGEFDETVYTGLPKNTLKVYDAVRGGNVPKSYVDPGVFQPIKHSLQIETELNYSDLRRNGWKSIARVTELAREAFEQEMFYRLFAGIDSAIDALGGGDQDIDAGSSLTISSMDAFSRYLRDMSDGQPFAVGLSKYVDQIKRMDGHEAYLSDDMKNELNRLGYLSTYDGIIITSVPTAKKTSSGRNLIPDKRIFGIAGKIGDANMRGELRTYQTPDNDKEKVYLKFTGYEFEYVIYYLDKIARITFA